MISVGDDDNVDEETQQLDSDSPRSDYQCTMPQDDTLSLDNETELVRDVTCFYGETQVLEEGPECVADEGGGNWVDTQVVDGLEDACAADDDDKEDTERTEVLSDGGGISDDDAATGGVQNCGDGGRGHGGELTCTANRPEKDSAVDSDASTDDGHCRSGPVLSSSFQSCWSSLSNPESKRRSFASVRVASLRASGLSRRGIIPRQDPVVEAPSVTETEKDIGMTGTREQTVLLETGAGELHLDCDSDSLDKFTKCNFQDGMNQKNRNRRIRKLFDEETCAEKDGSTSKISCNSGKEDLSCTHSCDCTVAGLSYIGSQEPGELSQANALDVVDRILSINDIGLSQDACIGRASETKLPPLSGAKVAQQCLAKASHKSPVGKGGIYEWDDALEDEGGGDFFIKSKSSIFVIDKRIKKSHSQPPKSKRLYAGIAKGSVEKVGRKDDVKPEVLSKVSRSSLSDTRIKLYGLVGSGAYKVAKEKNLLKKTGEQINTEPTEQHLEETDVGIAEENIYDVGPDTQMAAEAMEALFCAPPVEKDSWEAHPVATGMTKDCDQNVTMKNGSSGHVALQKRKSLVSDPEGTVRKSKRIKSSDTELSIGNPPYSTKKLTRSRMRERITEDKLGETESLNEKSKTKEKSIFTMTSDNQQSDGKSIHLSSDPAVKRGGESSSSVKTKVRNTTDKTSTRNMDHGGACVPNAQLPLYKELVEEDKSFTPVAHKTRLFKTRTSVQVDPSSFSNVHKMNGLEEADNTHIRGLHSESSAPEAGLSSSECDMLKTDGLLQETCKPSSIVRVAPGHPKRRRTRLDYSRDSSYAVNQAGLCEATPGTGLLFSMQPNQSKTDGKSFLMIQGDVSRKRRTAGSCLPSEADGMMSNRRINSMPSNVRTRSRRYISSTELNSLKSIKGKILFGRSPSNNNSSDTSTHEKMLSKEFAQPICIPKSTIHVKDVGHSKLESSPNAKVHLSGTTCSPLKETTTGSPVCSGGDLLKMLNKKCLSRPLTKKELTRLETKLVPLTPLSKDLRRRRDMGSICALFSRHLDDDTIKQQTKILVRLGVPIASTISDATHFISDKFVRTRNMLEAMAVGKPVVTPLWLESCGQASCFIDEREYILRDLKKEKEIGFSMPVSLAHACQTPLFQGKRVFITRNVKPDLGTVSSLIKAAGGQPLRRIGRTIMKDENVPKDLFVISCEDDYTICTPLLEKGAEVFDSELLLNGIVIQKLEFERHRLFLDHVKRTRSTIWLRSESGDQFLPVTKCK